MDSVLERVGELRRLPYYKREAVNAIEETYPSHAEGVMAVRQALTDFYQQQYPDLWTAEPELVEEGADVASRVYGRTVFPAMDTDYDGTSDISAVYAMAELPVTPRFEIVFGARYETTEIEVVPFNQEFGTVWKIVEVPAVDDQGNPTGGFPCVDSTRSVLHSASRYPHSQPPRTPG